MVTYEQLKHGYTLKVGDKLVLHGIKYEVHKSFFIFTCESSIYGVIFEKLGIKDPLEYASRFGKAREGGFPFMDSMESLTKLVIALYEIPEYKEGDWVTILPKDESDNYSPICYTGWMTNHVGKTFMVKSNNLRDTTNTCDGVDNGDPHSYELIGVSHYWTTKMIRKATEEEIRKAKGEVKDFDRPTSWEMMTHGRISPLSEETAKKLNAEVEEMIKSISIRPWDINPPVYAPWWKDTPSDTEVRLPKNEDSTPHIKL